MQKVDYRGIAYLEYCLVNFVNEDETQPPQLIGVAKI